MESKISVIIPVYNVEKYVETSILSICAQSYPNIEILVVDDGSTDDSGKICDRLAQNDNRIKVFHKENGGQGSARNLALEHAEGEYVCFLDSDDIAKPDYIQFLYDMMKRNELDIAACNYELYDEDGRLLRIKNEGNGYFEYSSVDAINSMWYGGPINIGPWAKLYKMSLWKDIRFRECFAEDLATMHKIFIGARKIGYDYIPLMEYLLRKNSSIRLFQEKKFIMIEIVADNMLFANTHPELMSAARHKACSVYFHLLLQLTDKEKYGKEIKLLKKLIKEIRNDVLMDPRCTKKTKCALMVSFFGFNATKMLFKFAKKRDASL